MSFFGEEDPFESIVREFFGETPRRNYSSKRVIRSEDDERKTDFLKTSNNIYFIFNLPGFEEKDIEVSVTNEKVGVNAKKRDLNQVQGYLSSKLSKGVRIYKNLPEDVDIKNFKKTFSNGILELTFRRKKK